MCGIMGYVDFSGLNQDEARVRLKRMADSLVHRGPDEEGFHIDGFAALGHRRLSIIDLSTGQQPMSALDGQVQIVFNGEIYNFPDLRAELEAKGYRFKSHCDTEVILIGYLEWGKQCVEKLSGMFAFVIWDARDRRLVLARDRVGKKPLYYCRLGSRFAFASELKALRAGGLCPEEVDPESLDCYFSFGYVPAPRTIYKGVRKLRPAHCLMASAYRETEQQYWRLSFAEPVSRPLDEAVEEFEALLDEAVKCRLMSEVPLGAFLSGGLDSSLVVASMAKLTLRPVITNSIGFEDKRFNELPAASIIANHLGTDHHEFVVEPEITDVLERIARHFDEPFADPSAVPMWYVCEMAKRTVTVALSGDGGDEGFGGYTFRYLPHLMESRIRVVIPALIRRPLFGVLGALWPASSNLPRPFRLKTIMENISVGDSEAFYRDLIWLRSDVRAELYSPDFMAELKGFTPMEAVQPYYAETDASDALSRSQSADVHFYMTDDVLVKVDRMSMAHSLEVRCPLLDHRVLEFAARLPTSLKVRTGKGKLLLRALAARRLPEETIHQPKRGFSIPAACWLRGDLRALAEGAIFGGNCFIAPFIDRVRLKRIWNEHQSGSRDHSVFLWGSMMLGLWQKASAGSGSVP